jgi:hypothetical protein
LQFSKNFGKILDSIKLQKFQAHNTKAMAKDKKVNIAVTQTEWPTRTIQKIMKV